MTDTNSNKKKKPAKYNKKRLILIYGTGVWIYALAVYNLIDGGFSELSRLGQFAFAFGTYIPFVVIYFIAVAREKPEKRKELMGHDDYNYQSNVMKNDIIHAFVSVFGAIILAFATFVVVGWEDHKNEFGAWFTTCERDSSKIITMPVNKVVKADDARITVHNVTYNVPQSSKRPQPYSNKCEKATLVDVTVERKVGGNTAAAEKIRPSDFTLQTKDDSSVSPESSTDEYDHYAGSKNIEYLDRSIDEETRQERGWLVFSIYDDNSNSDSTLVYGEYPYDDKPSVALPAPKVDDTL